MAFDPNAHLRNLKGQMYLDVKWRLLWLREDHPNARISTDLVTYREDQQMWVFKAVVIIPDKGSATGHGQETERDFPAGACEKAETKSIGRALAALGYGTQFALDRDASESDGDRPADSPVQPAKAVPRPNQSRPASQSKRSPAAASVTPAPSTPPASAPTGAASAHPASSVAKAQPQTAEDDPQQVLRLNARITELCAALSLDPPQSVQDLAALGQARGWPLAGPGPASVTWKEQLIVRLEVARQRAALKAALAADPDATGKLPKAVDAMTAEELDKTLTWLQNRARRHAPAITEPACDEALEPGPTASPLGEPWTEPDVLNALAAATQEEIDGIAAEIGMSVNAGVLTEDLARQLRACVTLARRAFTVTSAGSMAQVEINAGEMRTNLDLTVDQYDALIALTHRVRAMRGWVASNGANSRQAATAGAGTR